MLKKEMTGGRNEDDWILLDQKIMVTQIVLMMLVTMRMPCQSRNFATLILTMILIILRIILIILNQDF